MIKGGREDISRAVITVIGLTGYMVICCRVGGLYVRKYYCLSSIIVSHIIVL